MLYNISVKRSSTLKKERMIILSTKTRIGISSIVRGSGSVELPEEINLFCPQCKTGVADKGQCIAEFFGTIDSSGNVILKVMVDCRICGCYNKEPILFFHQPEAVNYFAHYETKV
jgi:hypothetical protein